MINAINPKIFRDYDIRGIYPSELDEDTFYSIGRAAAIYLDVPEIAVGHDTRLSSPGLSRALISGIMDQGTNVTDLGLISTEIHYFASGKFGFGANIIISASHNPAQYNGLKIVKRGVVPLHGNFGLPQIKQLALEGHFPDKDQKGILRTMNIMDDWIGHALKFINKNSIGPLSVVVDAGSGMGGISWKEIIGKIPGLNIIPLYFEPDGRFPYHLPDPLKEENTVTLRNKVLETNSDLGIALDGDADRMFMVDDQGKSVSGTLTTAILAKALLMKFGANPVLYNAVCGRVVPETISQYKGIPVRVRVGHSFIKEYMKKNNALFAGEHSGHFYFRDNYNAESSLIAGLIVLEFLSNEKKKLSEITAMLDRYPSSGEINFQTETSEALLINIDNSMSDKLSSDWLDGLSVWYKDWWFNLRASKTEPFVRLNVEADNLKILKQHTAELEALIQKNGGKKV